MRRRDFITLLALVAWPVTARAQPASIKRIGVLFPTDKKNPEQQSRFAAFVRGLKELGWSEGQNIRFEQRWAGGSAARLRSYAEEIFKLAPDVVLVQGFSATVAIHNIDKKTPIVFVAITDPVHMGLVTSLSHPGGSVTGFTVSEREMGGKWLELLKQIAPSVSKAMVFASSMNTARLSQAQLIKKEGPQLGIAVSVVPISGAMDIESAISAFATSQNGGLVVLSDSVTITHRKLIVALAAHYRLPAIYDSRTFPITGGLVSYGASRVDLFSTRRLICRPHFEGRKAGRLANSKPNQV